VICTRLAVMRLKTIAATAPLPTHEPGSAGIPTRYQHIGYRAVVGVGASRDRGTSRWRWTRTRTGT
jgi:hypothetical protein